MKSVAVNFMFFICLAVGCETDHEVADLFRYTAVTGHVSRIEADFTSPGYFVTVVYREDRTPWLIIAKSNDADPHFRVTNANKDFSITIDGIGYTDLPGKTVVISHKSHPAIQTEHDTYTNAVIMSLQGGLDGIDATTLDLIMP